VGYQPLKFDGNHRIGSAAQIVLTILGAAGGPIEITEVTKLAETAGLRAVGGVGPSVRYHPPPPHLLGVTAVVNPTVSKITHGKPETVVIGLRTDTVAELQPMPTESKK
jgi:hypothetical protein